MATHTVESILTNEKYKGDAILQKTFTVDFLMKTKKANEGEVPQYYVENSHPAIISPEIFAMVQQEYKERKASGKWTSSTHCFSGKIICGECGRFYGSRVWHSNDQYRTTVWVCHNKIQNADACRAPHMREDTIRAAFVQAINALVMNKDEIIYEFEELAKRLGDTTDIDAKLTELQEVHDLAMGIFHQLVEENARAELDQEAFQSKYNAYMARLDTVKNRMADLEKQKHAHMTKRLRMMEFLTVLRQQDSLINEFCERMWYVTADTVTVHSMHLLTFAFKGGMEKDVEV